MATPQENITAELRNAIALLDKAVGGLQFKDALRIHGHIDDLLDDLFRVRSEDPGAVAV